jgi:integrase/recombinase XerD
MKVRRGKPWYQPPRESDPDSLRLVGGTKDAKRAEGYLRWLMSRGPSLGTVRTYGYHLTEFLRYCQKRRLELCQVRARHVVEYVGVQSKRPRPPSARTVNGQLSAMRGLFRYLSLMEPARFKLNPVEDAAPLAAPKRQLRCRGMLGHLRPSTCESRTLQLPAAYHLPQTLSPSAIAALQSSFRTVRDKAMALLMWLVGLRSCEVLSLCLGDVDFRNGMLRVFGKGSRERVVPVAPEVLRAIEYYVRTERPPTLSDKLFVVLKGPNRGAPLKPAGLRTVFRYHRKRAGVPGAHPHRLRHTFASQMVHGGMKLEDLQAQLGHANVDSSTVYVHLAPTRIREVYLEALARARRKRP